jgi:hypothetical protein
MVLNILAGIMAAIALGAGIYGMWVEKSGVDKEETKEKDK